VTHKFCTTISTQQTVMLYLCSCGHFTLSMFQPLRIHAWSFNWDYWSKEMDLLFNYYFKKRLSLFKL